MILLVVDMFPQTDDSWICFRKRRKRSKSVDMFPYTDDINLIATRHVETVALLVRYISTKEHVSITVKPDSRVPNCTKEKEAAIKSALKYSE